MQTIVLEFCKTEINSYNLFFERKKYGHNPLNIQRVPKYMFDPSTFNKPETTLQIRFKGNALNTNQGQFLD